MGKNNKSNWVKSLQVAMLQRNQPKFPEAKTSSELRREFGCGTSCNALKQINILIKSGLAEKFKDWRPFNGTGATGNVSMRKTWVYRLKGKQSP
jgi:hypothetical protein